MFCLVALLISLWLQSTQQLLHEGQGQGSQAGLLNDPSRATLTTASSATAPATAGSWGGAEERNALESAADDTWHLLSAGAATFWKQATEATTEMLSSLTPTEPTAQPQPQAAPSSGPNVASGGVRGIPSSSSTSSWDSVSDAPGRDELASSCGALTIGVSARSPVAVAPVRAPSSTNTKLSGGSGKGKDDCQADFFASFGV
jgi:hypothetical protein